MDFNKLPNAEVEQRFVIPSGSTEDQVSSPRDGEVYADTDLNILKVGFGGSYQQLNGLPIGDEQTASGSVKGGFLYPVNTSNGSVTLTIIAGQEANTRIGFFDPEGTWGTNAFNLMGDGETINGLSEQIVFSLANDSRTYIKSTGTRGWRTLMSTGDMAILKGWENVKTVTGSTTLAEATAYLLDLNATITFANADDDAMNVDYARKVGTATIGSYTTQGDYYWLNADNTNEIVGLADFTSLKGWVVGNKTGADTYLIQRGNAPIASPLGVVSFQTATGITGNNDVAPGNFVKNTYTFTLPDTATDQSAIMIGDYYGACGYGCTVTIKNSSQSFSLNEPYQYMVFQYSESDAAWTITRGGVLNHVSGDSNTPESITGTTTNNNTGYQHTHELTLATDDEVSDFSSDNPASLEQIRKALADRGFMWTPGTDDSTTPIFPTSSVNSITVPAGDYRVDSTISNTPETNGVVRQRYINANIAIQLFQGYNNNTLYIRNYPTTTSWLEIASTADVSTALSTAESYAANASHLTSGTVASARMASATTSAKGAVILATDANAEAGSGTGVVSAAQVNSFVQSSLALNMATQSIVTFSSNSDFAKNSGWCGFVKFSNGALSSSTYYYYKLLAKRDNSGGYGAIAMNYASGVTYSIKAATSSGTQTIRQLWDSISIPEATATTLSDTFQLWTSNLINSIVSANSVVTGHTSSISSLTSSVSTNTSNISTLSSRFVVSGSVAYMRYGTSNRVTTSSAGVSITGTITGSSSVTAVSFIYSSDRRLKKAIKTLSSRKAKQIVMGLNPVSFKWRKDGSSDYGFVAQEVEKVDPTFVKDYKDEKGKSLKAVKYGNLISPAITLLQEHEQEIRDLKQIVKKQQAAIDRLLKVIAA